MGRRRGKRRVRMASSDDSDNDAAANASASDTQYVDAESPAPPIEPVAAQQSDVPMELEALDTSPQAMPNASPIGGDDANRAEHEQYLHQQAVATSVEAPNEMDLSDLEAERTIDEEHLLEFIDDGMDEDEVDDELEITVPPPPFPHTSKASKKAHAAERLVIDRLELTDFKTFAGDCEVKQFHPRFLIINGPNGCGKSNVIDALLFVFGWKSRDLRGDSLLAMIHQRTDGTRCDHCKVTLHLKRVRVMHLDEAAAIGVAERYDDIAGSDFSISRSAHVSPRGTVQSTYHVDGSRATERDVKERLKRENIDIDHQRFLILQGDVESIALMPPKAKKADSGRRIPHPGFLEYLEDIIGTTRFVEPIERAENNVKKTKEDFEKKNRDVELCQADLDGIRSRLREAETTLTAFNERNYFADVVLQLEEHQIGEELDRERICLNDATDELHSAKKRSAEKKCESEEAQKAVKLAQSQRDKATGNKEQAVNEAAECSERARKLECKRKASLKSQSGLVEKIKDLKQEIDEVRQDEPDRLKAEIDTAEGLLPQIMRKRDDSKAHYDETLASLRQETACLDAKREAIQRRLTPLEEVEVKAERKLAGEQGELDGMSQAHQKECDRVTELEKAFDEAHTRLDVLTVESEKLDDRIATKSNLLQDAKDRRTACKERLAELGMQIPEMEHALDAHRERAEIERQAAKRRRPALRAILEEKISGVHGRLGDLAGIDPRYDTAISTIMPELNSIVVENSHVSEACIAHLKKRSEETGQVLREYFIDLKRQTTQFEAAANAQFSDPIANEADAPRLFDLVKPCHNRYRACFYKSLRDTLVVKTVPEARKLGLEARDGRRRRVVTENGELINTGGEMTGGGRPRSGFIGAQAQVEAPEGQGAVPAVDIDALVRELTGLRDDRIAKTDSCKTIEDQGKQIAIDIADLRKRKDTDLPSELADVQRICDAFPQRIADQRAHAASLRPDEERCAPVRARLNAAKDKLAKSKTAADAVRAEKKNVESELTNKTDTIVQLAKNAYTKAEKRYNDEVGALDALKSALANIDARCKKLSTTIAKKERELADVDKTLNADALAGEDLQCQLTELNVKIAKLTDEMVNVHIRLKALEDELNSLKEEESSAQMALDDIAKRRSAVKQRIRELLEKRKKKRKCRDSLEFFEFDDPAVVRNLQLAGDVDASLSERAARPRSYMRWEMSEAERAGRMAKIGQYRNRQQNAEDRCNLNQSNVARAIGIIGEWREFHKAWQAAALVCKQSGGRVDVAGRELQKLRTARHKEFFNALDQINLDLKWIFRKLTNGGNAELTIDDPMRFYECGIDFRVQPKLKPWRQISQLSGGEKTLSSLAFIFALHNYRPTPFYIMDEIDAALDWRNVSLVGLYVRLQATAGQFIVVSHRPQMIVKADRIMGVCRPGGMSNDSNVICYDLDHSVDTVQYDADMPEADKAAMTPMTPRAHKRARLLAAAASGEAEPSTPGVSASAANVARFSPAGILELSDADEVGVAQRNSPPPMPATTEMASVEVDSGEEPRNSNVRGDKRQSSDDESSDSSSAASLEEGSRSNVIPTPSGRRRRRRPRKKVAGGSAGHLAGGSPIVNHDTAKPTESAHIIPSATALRRSTSGSLSALPGSRSTTARSAKSRDDPMAPSSSAAAFDNNQDRVASPNGVPSGVYE